ncbi:hypothetical protein ABHN11_24390 [Brevibacillus centrosporus]|uniref:hypothetical protein n=1 Tax=Brevibacillus centrosporus TaxID=54910 RepID=UPI003D1A4AE9
MGTNPPWVDAAIAIGDDFMGWLALILYVVAGVSATVATIIYARADDPGDKKNAKDRGIQVGLSLLAGGSVSWFLNYVAEKAGAKTAPLTSMLIDRFFS